MATMPVTGYCTFHTTRERRCREPAARVQLWERRLSGSARRTTSSRWSMAIPAIRLSSRMMLCSEPRPSLQTEDPVGIPLAGPTGSFFCARRAGNVGAIGQSIPECIGISASTLLAVGTTDCEANAVDGATESGILLDAPLDRVCYST